MYVIVCDCPGVEVLKVLAYKASTFTGSLGETW